MTDRALLVIAVAGADGGVIQHLLDEGGLPHILSLIEAGTLAEVAWIPPSSHVAGWLTLACAAAPHDHGGLTAMVTRPDGFGVMPLDRDRLMATPLWEQIARGGRPVLVVNWPATHGSDGPDELTVVADSFFQIEGRGRDNWPAVPESVQPRRLTKALLDARVHPADLAASGASALGPDEKRVVAVFEKRGAIHLARLRSIVGVAVALLGREQAQVQTQMQAPASFIFLDLLEFIGLPRSARELPASIAAYRLVDAAVGRLLDAVSPEHTDIVLVTRPPTGAVQDPAGQAPRGLALFVSPDHRPDALGRGFTPLSLASEIARLAAVRACGISEPDPAGEAIADDWQRRLASRHPAVKSPLAGDIKAAATAVSRYEAVRRQSASGK